MKKNFKPLKFALKIPVYLIGCLFLPFYLLGRLGSSKAKTIWKLLILPLIILLIPVWLVIWLVGAVLTIRLGENIGIIHLRENIAGTGSMYPTFPKGSGKSPVEQINEIVANTPVRSYPGGFMLLGERYFGHKLQRGDIVSFANQKTKEIVEKEISNDGGGEVGFIKRVIGLPKDTIELRDGFVLLNGQNLDEPYIASARSTYGGEFLPDCKKLTIPPDNVFVMGDNRKGSDDSRFDVGLVSFSDIKSVIPLNEQSSSPGIRDGLKVNWRDTSNDLKTANQPILDTAEYFKLLNQKRVEASLGNLKFELRLALSAGKRADVILKYDDLSFEASKSGYTMTRSLADVGYSNIVYGETPTFGFYTAQELIENFFQFPDTKKFLLNSKYQETGISAKLGEINGCPVQVIVQHLAGYVPPNYSNEDKENWKKLIDSLNSIIPDWEQALSYPGINQEDLKKLLSLLNLRRDSAKAILARMEANQWLSNEEKLKVEQDQGLFEQIQQLAKKLNES